MMLATLNIVLARANQSFFSQHKVSLFFLALFLFAVAGFVVSLSDTFKKIFVVIFLIFMVFPAIDVNFYVDVSYIGTTRGLYITIADMFLLSLVIATLLGSKHKLIFLPRGMLPFLAFLGVAALSLASARYHQFRGFEHPGYVYGFFEIFNIFKGLMLFWFVMNFLRTDKDIKFIIYALVGTALLEVAYTGYAHVVLHDWSRARGSLGHPNTLAMFMGMFVPMLLVLAHTYRRRGLMGYIFIAAYVGSFGVIVKTGSRGGILTMIATSLIVVFFLLLNSRQINWGRVAIVGLIVLCGAGWVTVRYWDRVSQRFFQTAKEAKVSTQSRERLTDIGWEIAKKSIIIGNGINGFPIESATDSRYFDSNAVEHNLYLLQLAETGIIGLAAMLALFINFLRVGFFKVYRQKVSMTYRLLSVGLMCGLLHAMIHSYAEFIFRAISISYVFWVIGGTIMAMSYAIDRKKHTLYRLRRAATIARAQKAERGDVSHPAKVLAIK